MLQPQAQTADWRRAALLALLALGCTCCPFVPAKAASTPAHATVPAPLGQPDLGAANPAAAGRAGSDQQTSYRSAAADALAPQMADRVVVHKAERRMDLMHGYTVLRTYHVALGMFPKGPKEREGDSRTPEGRYFLTRRNARSDYFLSIQVSYPNKSDEARARAGHWDPGGAIMIHGRPNELRREPQYYETHDWTDGCISVSDSDMLEIWLMTQPGIPIDILP